MSNEYKPVKLVKDGVERLARTPDEETNLRFNHGFKTASSKKNGSGSSGSSSSDDAKK